MSQEQLRLTLEQLHAELSQTETLDEPSRALLQHTMADVQAMLAKADPEIAGNTPDLVARLQEGIQVFEVSHPTLSLAMQEVVALLSDAGI
jgi:hypothetical protein